MNPLNCRKDLLSICVLAILTFSILATTIDAFATDIRGRVDAIHQYSPQSPFPASGVKVDLYVYDGVLDTWQIIASNYTGVDGMYYMRNIRPGNYYLQVQNSRNYHITIHNQPFQDIQPILIRY